MRINIIVVTNNDELDKSIKAKRDALIPQSTVDLPYFRQTNATFALFSFLNFKDKEFRSLIEMIGFLRGDPGLIVVFEHGITVHPGALQRVAFTSQLYLDEGRIINAQNILAKVLSKTLRDFAIFSAKFDNAKFQNLLLLPLQNFMADESNDMTRLFSAQEPRDRFGEQLDGILKKLRDRQCPKQPKTRPTVYVKDDRKNCFVYGLERHALPDTDMPPHNDICILAQTFRFGRSYDPRRHFNVSVEPDGARISAEFLDCHDSALTFRDQTHVNMFPNGFCT